MCVKATAPNLFVSTTNRMTHLNVLLQCVIVHFYKEL
jgi:hypothetical protein